MPLKAIKAAPTCCSRRSFRRLNRDGEGRCCEFIDGGNDRVGEEGIGWSEEHDLNTGNYVQGDGDRGRGESTRHTHG